MSRDRCGSGRCNDEHSRRDDTELHNMTCILAKHVFVIVSLSIVKNGKLHYIAF